MAEKKRISLDMEFADGTVRTVKPLKISQLRKFMQAVAKLDVKAEDFSDKDIDTIMDAAEIVMNGIDPALAADRKKLEDAIDVEIFWNMVTVAMGNRVEDNPNE